MIKENKLNNNFCYVWNANSEYNPELLGKLSLEDGKFIFQLHEKINFSYLKNVIYSEDLSDSIQSDKKTFINDELFYAFRDSSPDAWGRNVLIYNIGADYNSFSEIDFLLLTHQDRIGNLVFTETDDIVKAKRIIRKENSIDLNDFISAIEKIKENPFLDLSDVRLNSVLQHGTSVGGARPKILLTLDDKKYLAKFSLSTDVYDVIEAEYLAMQLAKKVGINVADSKLIEIDNKKALLVERFDRVKNKDGFFDRKNIVSALSALNLNELQSSYASYSEFYQKIRDNQFDNVKYRVGQAPLNEEIFRRIVFNIVVGNNDDHARNHACFYKNEKFDLTPCYDVCPLPRKTGETSQAMGIGEWSRKSNLITCVQNAELYDLNQEKAINIIDNLIVDFAKNIQAVVHSPIFTIDVENNKLLEIKPSQEKIEKREKLFKLMFKTAIFNDSIFYGFEETGINLKEKHKELFDNLFKLDYDFLSFINKYSINKEFNLK